MCWMPVAKLGPYNCTGNCDTHCCVVSPNYSTLAHPPKRIGTSRMISETWYNSEPIIGKSHSRLGCLHTWYWAIDIIFVCRRHEIMFRCTGSGVNYNCKRIPSCVWCQQRTARSIVAQADLPPTATYRRPNATSPTALCLIGYRNKLPKCL